MMPVKSFEDPDSLIDEVRHDQDSMKTWDNRFPVRFIFLYSFSTLRELISRLNGMDIRMFELQEYLSQDDGWFTKDDLIDIVKNIENNSIVIPFSEIARFFKKEDFNNIFSRLLTIENFRNNFMRRIYLPLMGLRERFERDFQESFYRRGECPPIWEVKEERFSTIKIFLFNEKLDDCNKLKIPVIQNSRQWLSLWKQPESPSFLCFSRSLNYLYKNALPDQMFDIEKIENKKDFIKKIFDLEFPISFDSREGNHWHRMIKILGDEGHATFQEIIRTNFNISEINETDIIKLWIENDDDFKRWLLKSYTLSQASWGKKYLYDIIQGLDNLDTDSLLKNLWLSIFDQKESGPHIRERQRLLKAAYKTKKIPLSRQTENKIKRKIEEIDDSQVKLNLTTGILAFEKCLLIKLLVEEDFKNIDFLKEKYPHLYFYFKDSSFNDLEEKHKWIREYFKEYKRAKLKNEYSADIQDQINRMNSNQDDFFNWYYSFPQVKEITKDLKVDNMIWIDALGVEWTSLIESILKERGYQIEKKLIGKVHLPSITETNRYNADCIQEFDNLIHSSGHYRHPQSIVDEIEKIAEILETKIVLDKNQKIAITSDHGSSALVRLASRQKYDFKDAKHEGRYIELNDKANDSGGEDYVIFKNENNKKLYMVASKHQSLHQKPTREVHGGCTPEEVLVPIIIVSNPPKVHQPGGYEIDPDVFKISRMPQKNPTLSLSIEPEPTQRPLLVDKSEITYELEFHSNDEKWHLEFPKNIKSGQHILDLKIGDFRKQIVVTITGGLVEKEDLF